MGSGAPGMAAKDVLNERLTPPRRPVPSTHEALPNEGLNHRIGGDAVSRTATCSRLLFAQSGSGNVEPKGFRCSSYASLSWMAFAALGCLERQQ